MDEFHFLRPAWLLLVPVALGLVWRLASGRGKRGGWLAVIDAGLQPHVLAEPEALRERRWPLVLAAIASVAALIGLAGPAWERLPVPAFRSDEALVVAVDLSRSMDAGDVEPTRLARARLKLMSLLDRRLNGQTALVVFSAHAFTVTPLTTDTRTIASLVGALTTDIMPSQGSYPEVGLEKAASLLRQTGMRAGEILLISDAVVSPAALDAARDLRREGFVVHVLAVGTEEGAPIPEHQGGFLTDSSGQVVVPRLEPEGLRRLAEAGGGLFAQLTASDRDLDALFREGAIGDVSVGADDEVFEADVWQDRGIWVAVLLLPLVALGFRRGWIYGVAVCLLLPVPRAEAFTWADLWQRPDQRGIEALEADDPAAAAALFEDRQWRAAASYRAGDFPTSASSLTGIDTAEAQYNRGNALAKSGELGPAIEAYDRTLELEPEHEDALYNRELVSELLEQQQQQQEQQQQQQEGEQGQGEQSEQTAQNQESETGENDESQPPSDDAEARDDQQQTDSGEDRQDGDFEDEQEEQQAAAPEEPAESEQQLQASVRPEDIEEWASEQAAEQWLRRIPQDPGGLLRRKFLYQYQRLGVDQDGNYVWPGDGAEPW
jgi:Ca-activated chloride channel family protein